MLTARFVAIPRLSSAMLAFVPHGCVPASAKHHPGRPASAARGHLGSVYNLGSKYADIGDRFLVGYPTTVTAHGKCSGGSVTWTSGVRRANAGRRNLRAR